MKIDMAQLGGRMGFRIAEVSAMLGISTGLVRNAINCGALRATRVGKRGRVVTKEALEEWLKNCAAKGDS